LQVSPPISLHPYAPATVTFRTPVGLFNAFPHNIIDFPIPPLTKMKISVDCLLARKWSENFKDESPAIIQFINLRATNEFPDLRLISHNTGKII
jgi:hypothetical protein